MSDIFQQLSKPFPAADIEWRIQQSGVSNNGRVWAMVLAYVTNRAIQNRLDEACGPMGWKNEYREEAGGVMCGISIWCKDRKEWITKWDGAEKTDVESFKGGLSASMKRAAVQWGIGRYLYKLESGFADCFDGKQGANRGAAKARNGQKVCFSWNPPALPDWALPEDERRQSQPQSNKHNNGYKKQPDAHYQQQVQPSPAPVAESRHNTHPTPATAASQTQTTSNNRSQANCGTGGAVLMPHQVKQLKEALNKAGIQEHEFLGMCKLERLGQLQSERFPKAISWIRDHSAGAA